VAGSVFTAFRTKPGAWVISIQFDLMGVATWVLRTHFRKLIFFYFTVAADPGSFCNENYHCYNSMILFYFRLAELFGMAFA
jgi:hypothetical protein